MATVVRVGLLFSNLVYADLRAVAAPLMVVSARRKSRVWPSFWMTGQPGEWEEKLRLFFRILEPFSKGRLAKLRRMMFLRIVEVFPPSSGQTMETDVNCGSAWRNSFPP